MTTITLEITEELGALLARVSEHEDADITLVIPPGAAIARHVALMQTLARELARLHKRVIVTSTDSRILLLARRAGLPMREQDTAVLPQEILQTGATTVSDKPATDKKSTKKFGANILSKKTVALILILFIVLAALGGSIVFLALPKATISVVAATKDTTVRMDMVALASKTSVSSADHTIPLKAREVKADLSQEADATGERQVGEKAGGTITVYNLYSTSSYPLPPTTFDDGKGHLFESTSSVSVPGYSDNGTTKTAGSVTIAVRAVQAGATYNIGASSFSLPDVSVATGGKIYAQSDAVFSGGTDKVQRYVSSDDVNKVRAELEKDLLAKAIDALKLDGNTLTFGELAALGLDEVTTDPKLGKDGDKFTMHAKLTGTIYTIDRGDMEKVARETIAGFLGDQVAVDTSAGLTLDPKIKAYDIKDLKQATFDVAVTSHVVAKLDTRNLARDLAGQSKDAATKLLADRKDTIFASRILLWPFWVRSVPRSVEKIEVKVVEQL